VDDHVVADTEGNLVLDELVDLLLKLLFGDAGLNLQKVERFKAGGIIPQGSADLFAVGAAFLEL